MSDFVGDRIAFPHLTALRDAIGPELDARGLPGLCEGLIGAGAQTAFDYCDTSCDGMSWVRLDGAYASRDFPNADAEANRGRLLMAETFELGIVRGIDLPDDPAQGMDPAVLEDSAAVQLADMSALLAVICAYFGGLGVPYIVGSYTPYGPQGACVGGSWSVTAQTGVAPKAKAV